MGRSDDYIWNTVEATTCVGASIRLDAAGGDYTRVMAVPSRKGDTVCASLFIDDPQKNYRVRLGDEPLILDVLTATIVVKNCTATNTVTIWGFK